MSDFAFPNPADSGGSYVSGTTQITALGYTWTWYDRDGSGYWLKESQPTNQTGIADKYIFFSNSGARAGSIAFRWDHTSNTLELEEGSRLGLTQGTYLMQVIAQDGSDNNSILPSGLYKNEVADGSEQVRVNGEWTTSAGSTANFSYLNNGLPAGSRTGDILLRSSLGRDVNDYRGVYSWDGAEWDEVFKAPRIVDNVGTSNIPDEEEKIDDWATGGVPAWASDLNRGDLVMFQTNTSGNRAREVYAIMDHTDGSGDLAFYSIGGTGSSERFVRTAPTEVAQSTIAPVSFSGTSASFTVETENNTRFMRMANSGGVSYYTWDQDKTQAWENVSPFNFTSLFKRVPTSTNLQQGMIQTEVFETAETGTIEVLSPTAYTQCAFVAEIDNTASVTYHPEGLKITFFQGNPHTSSGTTSFTEAQAAKRAISISGNRSSNTLPFYYVDRDGRTTIVQSSTYAGTRLYQALNYTGTLGSASGTSNLIQMTLSDPTGYWNLTRRQENKFLSFNYTGSGLVRDFYVTANSEVYAREYNFSSDASTKANIAYQNTAAAVATSAYADGYYGMAKLRNIQTANWTDPNDTSSASLGFIADDLYDHMPDIVHTTPDDNETKSVDLVGLVAVLANAIKELDARITTLEA